MTSARRWNWIKDEKEKLCGKMRKIKMDGKGMN